MTTKKVTLLIFSERQAMFFHLKSPKETVISKWVATKLSKDVLNVWKTPYSRKGKKKTGLLKKKRKEKSIFMAFVSLGLPFPCANRYYYPESYWIYFQPRQKSILNVSYAVRKRKRLPLQKRSWELKTKLNFNKANNICWYKTSVLSLDFISLFLKVSWSKSWCFSCKKGTQFLILALK